MARLRVPAIEAAPEVGAGWSAREIEAWRAGRRSDGACACPVVELLGRPCPVLSSDRADGGCFARL